MGLAIAEGIADKLGYIGTPYGQPFVAAAPKGGGKTGASCPRTADRMASHSRWI